MLGLTNSEPELTLLSDEELLQLSKLKPWLFGKLVERYQAAFLRKALNIVRDPRDAEEVVLDTFTKIYVHADSFVPQSGAQFSSWAYRILMNTAFTRYQKLIKEGSGVCFLIQSRSSLWAGEPITRALKSNAM